MSFSTKEIVDIAVGVEETGYEFYRAAMKKFKETAVSEVFDFLAREEIVHKELFQSMASAKGDEGVFTDEYYSYLKAIGGARIFDRDSIDANTIISTIDTPLRAVQYAFNAEKDSILLYSEMKGLYREGSENIGVLDRIIAEERKHVTTLIDLSDKLLLAGSS